MKRRRILFVMILLPSILLPAYLYLGWRLGEAGLGWLLMALPFVCVLFFPVLVLRRTSGRGSRLEDFLARLAYVNMGFVSFLLVAFLARDLLGLVSGRWVSPFLALCAAALMLTAGIYGGAFGPFVRKVKINFSKLPAGLVGARIAQISDLHLSTNINLRYVERVVRKVRELAPDLVVLTGDIGDGHVADLRPEIEALKGLGAPVFYATGNHEVYWNFEEWMSTFRGLGMKVLLNAGERVRIRGEDVFIGGITDPACEAIGLGPDLARTAAGSDGAAFRVLLSHRPDPADAAAAAGFDLQLSGHTHGGQFVPWTIVAGLVHKYSLGLYRIGKMFVYVSAGTGSWGPRIRLGTTAEVTLLELTSETN
jgi:predicted MPP superfamily phosphohydrolase